MAEHGIIQSVRNFGSLLSRFQKQKERQLKLSKIGLLGARFADEIANTTDLSTLSDTLIRLNKAAFIAGVPELSSNINNLGRLRQLQITEAEKTLTATDQSDFYRNALQDELVLVRGEFIRFGDTDEFKSVGELKPELQAGAFQELAKRFATRIETAINPLADGSYHFSFFAISELTGEKKLIRKLAPTTSGVYEEIFDLITPKKGFGTDIPETFPEPIEITQDRAKRKRDLDLFKTKVDIQTEAQRKRGLNRSVLAAKLADDKNFKDPKKFESLRNELESNLAGATQTLQTTLGFFATGVGKDTKLAALILKADIFNQDTRATVDFVLSTDAFLGEGNAFDELLAEAQAGELDINEIAGLELVTKAKLKFELEKNELAKAIEKRKRFIEPSTDNIVDPPKLNQGPIIDATQWWKQ